MPQKIVLFIVQMRNFQAPSFSVAPTLGQTLRKLAVIHDHGVKVVAPPLDDRCNVLSDLAALIPVTSKEIEAIDAFLVGELDRLLAKSESCVIEAVSDGSVD